MIKEVFLQLGRLGIGHANSSDIPRLSAKDWTRLQMLAERQGLRAIVLDGVDRLMQQGVAVDMPTTQKKMWIGQVLQNYEWRHDLYRRAIADLAGFYNSHGFKMMVLKGYACAVDWPKPSHRPSGDIDIWQFGDWKEADAALIAEKRVRVDSSHHYHTVFRWHDFTVENHFDFINVHLRKSNAKLERVFKTLGDTSNIDPNDSLNLAQDSASLGTRITWMEVFGERVYLPSPNLHGLFLIWHAVAHFAAAEITLRQVLDWLPL